MVLSIQAHKHILSSGANFGTWDNGLARKISGVCELGTSIRWTTLKSPFSLSGGLLLLPDAWTFRVRYRLFRTLGKKSSSERFPSGERRFLRSRFCLLSRVMH